MKINGRTLYVESIGSGRPLIMLHGNGEDHTIFDKAAEILEKDYTCIMPDTRGHGQSEACDDLHYEDMADDVIALMETLDLQDVCLYGFSDGGIVGLLAAMRSDRITDLIVSGANLTPEGTKGWLRAFMRTMYLFRKDPKVRLMLEEPHITKEDLARIKARTLVLAGEKDLILESQTLQIASGIEGAVCRILKGEGHGSYIVHSLKIGELIRNWLKHGTIKVTE